MILKLVGYIKFMKNLTIFLEIFILVIFGIGFNYHSCFIPFRVIHGLPNLDDTAYLIYLIFLSHHQGPNP